ncbi:MAG TPA: AbrB/MazE/SpoVT family DNA-binding domain-containing protein [Candidatus Lokiarchaeia archaeon]|nr:AbrB/MazE/SpoVT family DNA-binding domain-containing protein [Candidatus Lokiarchaeia archaeon]
MVKSKPSIVNRKGMITIPSALRERFDLHEGSRVTVMEIDGNLVIIPLVDIEKSRSHKYAEFAKVEDETRAMELELEK